MDDLFLLSEAQMRRIEPYFPLSHGVPRVDDRLIVSAIIFVIKNGLRWRDAPRTYGPHADRAGRRELALPPAPGLRRGRLYSPDFNPIEKAFARLKAMLRKAAERTVSGLWDLVGPAFIAVDAKGHGEMTFGALEASLDCGFTPNGIDFD